MGARVLPGVGWTMSAFELWVAAQRRCRAGREAAGVAKCRATFFGSTVGARKRSAYLFTNVISASSRQPSTFQTPPSNEQYPAVGRGSGVKTEYRVSKGRERIDLPA